MFETLWNYFDKREYYIFSPKSFIIKEKKKIDDEDFCPLEKNFIDMMIGINSFVHNVWRKASFERSYSKVK